MTALHKMVFLPVTRGGALVKVCALMVLSLVGSITGQGVYADTTGGRVAPWRIERDIRRFKFVATDNVMNLLAIRPGMTILDIGAGTGQFAYEFSSRLNGTGNVYATDTKNDCIEYMKKEAGRRGLRNLYPVLVKKDGIDDFYGKHKYDLITVFHVAMIYEDQVDYFRELRRSLAEHGRLILILYKDPTPFSSSDITGDFRELVKALSGEPVESPYYRILRDSTRRKIRGHPEAESSEELRRAIVEDFNEMLSDSRFHPHFFNGSVFRKEARFLPEEQRYADLVLPRVPDNSVGNLDSRVRNRVINLQSASEGRRFAAINKLLIIQRYRRFLKRDGLFMSGFTPPIKAAFEKAGYRLVGEYSDVIPFEDMIIFSAR